MTYPLNSLVLIAPILFLVLIIVTPIIGVFAGWKRAAYWGGGTFLFFLIGVIIWKTTGAKIVAFAKPMLNSIISSISPSATVTDKMLVSIAAPIFFILVMCIAELILLINYYAWFKRVSKIKQDIQVKKAFKLAKKSKTKMKNQPKGWSAMQVTTKGKIINMTCGGAGLALLMAPSTITFSQALFYTTTSVETRATNKFSLDIYNALQKTIKPFSWMSYYGSGDTANDYNSLFSLLALSNTTTEYEYFDSNGNVVTGTGNVAEAMTNVITGGIQTLIKQTTDGQTTKEEKVENTNSSITTLAGQWNTIVEANSSSVNSVFSSDSVTEIMKQVIGDTASKKQVLTEDQITENYLAEDSVFEQVYNDYFKRSESEKLIQIPVSQETFNNVVGSMKEVISYSSEVTSSTKSQFEQKMNDIAALMFKVV